MIVKELSSGKEFGQRFKYSASMFPPEFRRSFHSKRRHRIHLHCALRRN